MPNERELDGKVAELERKLADAQISIQELEGKILKDIAAIHRSLVEYKQANDSTVNELRGTLTLLARRRP